VGAALNVHEGPQGISFNFANQTPLQPGMVLSNEPGFYQAGQFGIRIENLLVVVPAFEAPSPLDPKQRQYLKFERLTHIPICKKLIVKELLSEQEVQWVDAYHRDVWDKVSPLIDDAQAKDWLREATTPL
jgi:Xaa-Pro aminopeptidase